MNQTNQLRDGYMTNMIWSKKIIFENRRKRENDVIFKWNSAVLKKKKVLNNEGLMASTKHVPSINNLMAGCL